MNKQFKSNNAGNNSQPAKPKYDGIPVDNSNAPDDFFLYPDCVRNLSSKTGEWFYRNSNLLCGPYYYLCNCDDPKLSSGLTPHQVKNLNDNEKRDLSQKPVDPVEQKITVVPQKTYNPATPLPQYKKPSSPKAPRTIVINDDQEKVDVSKDLNFAIHCLNTSVTELSRQLQSGDKKWDSRTSVTENSITHLYKLNESMKSFQSDFVNNQTYMVDYTEAMRKNTDALRGLTQAIAKKPVKKRKTESDSDKDKKKKTKSNGESLLDALFPTKDAEEKLQQLRDSAAAKKSK